MGRLRNSNGFTLPEILIAGTLFALIVVAVTTSMRVSLGVDRSADLKRQAAIKLQSAIDSLVDRYTCHSSPCPTNVWPIRINCELALGGSSDSKIPCHIQRPDTNSTPPTFGGVSFGAWPTPHIYLYKIYWENDSLSQEVFHHRIP
jgi:type II secretory pathway component PulJ